MDVEKLAKLFASLGVCVGALVTLWEIIKELLRIKSARLKGQWIGDRYKDEWDLEGELRREKKDIVSGRIRWTLRECRSDLPWAAHIGKNGYEVVNGDLQDGFLRLNGTEVIVTTSNTPADLIGLSKYTIPCPSNPYPSKAVHFSGTSEPRQRGEYQEGGKMCGEIRFSRKRIFLSNE